MNIALRFHVDPGALPEGMSSDDVAALVGERFEHLMTLGVVGTRLSVEDVHDRAHRYLWDALNAVLGSGVPSPFTAIAGTRGRRMGQVDYEVHVDWRNMEQGRHPLCHDASFALALLA